MIPSVPVKSRATDTIFEGQPYNDEWKPKVPEVRPSIPSAKHIPTIPRVEASRPKPQEPTLPKHTPSHNNVAQAETKPAELPRATANAPTPIVDTLPRPIPISQPIILPPPKVEEPTVNVPAPVVDRTPRPITVHTAQALPTFVPDAEILPAPKVIPQPVRPTIRINLNDLAPVVAPAKPSTPTTKKTKTKPRSSKGEDAELPIWPKGVPKPAQAWITGLPKPSTRSLAFYENGLKMACACAWVDQATDQSELSYIRSWTSYAKMHAANDTAVTSAIGQAAEMGLKAGRISTAEALLLAEKVAENGSRAACKCVGNLCLSIITADKVLAQGEISLVASIWKKLELPLTALRKALERIIKDNKEMCRAIDNAELEDHMDLDEKVDALKRRVYNLNARMQNRKGADLEHDKRELQILVLAMQIYREINEHV
jgi:hypothetical protein